MPEPLSTLIRQLREIWRHFGPSQKATVAISLVSTLAIIGGLLYWSARPEFRLLYSGVSLKDAAAMREKLEEERILLKFGDAGHSIFVPANDVYRARLLLASSGFPKETSAGFELFEQPKFGLTDFAQKVNYQRALQGELERTIAAMDGIQSARVMLVLPEDRLFAPRTEQASTASIMLTLAGGGALAPAQVRSITHMVGSSVPGLQPTAITITDQFGNLLSRRSVGEDDEMQQAGEQLAAQEKVEAFLASKAQEMLDRALGKDCSIVKVNVAMDFSSREKRSEMFDDEKKTVRSETIESETTSNAGSGSGAAAGVVANIPIGNPGSATMSGDLGKSKKENVRTEYAIPSDVEHVVEKGAKIRHVSVSVCVAKGVQARAAEDLAKIETIVRAAVGVMQDETRKDTITVAEMDFVQPRAMPSTPWWQAIGVHYESLFKGIGAVVLLLFLYSMGKRLLWRTAVLRGEGGIPITALTGEESIRLPGSTGPLRNAARPEGTETYLAEIAELARRSPEAIAAWVSAAGEET